MSLTFEAVHAIARLAKLSISESNLPKIQTDLNSILQIIDSMQSIDTEGILPMTHPFDGYQRLRVDEITEINHRDEYQLIAPAVQDGLYLVPKVIE
jgi:aspartyl-tRNA(Asn)/glutamyl-tRNA(Gln) amidotransferase subunit C